MARRARTIELLIEEKRKDKTASKAFPEIAK
jgi:hypothetical protein